MVKTIARFIISIVFIIGVVILISLILAGLFPEKSDAHYFFIGVADLGRIILMVTIPVWILAFIFGIGN